MTKSIRRFLLLMVVVGLPFVTMAQFTTYGKISYERKTNAHQLMDDMADDDDDNSWIASIKAQTPKFSTTYFEYYFTTQNSLYKPGKESDNKYKGWGAPPAADNIVFTDFIQARVTAAKQVYEESFLVKDSLRKLEWKIGDEVRMIAQFKCRKAITKLFDSVVVVAFYTDDIPVSGGPEMFGGLPGAILQLVIPRLHTTWIATQVEGVLPNTADIKEPNKGKQVTQEALYNSLNKTVSKWGKWGQRSIWWSML